MAIANTSARIREASLGKRCLSMIYETLLLGAVLLAGALLFSAFTRQIDPTLVRPLLQLYLVAVCGGYFVWHWLHGGQTLAMRAWRIKLVTCDGTPLTLRHGIYRFVFALVSVALGGAGFLWALADGERQFLHDRLAGTRLIQAEG